MTWKKFDAYRVYYAGEEVTGFPLEHIEGGEIDGRPAGWS